MGKKKKQKAEKAVIRTAKRKKNKNLDQTATHEAVVEWPRLTAKPNLKLQEVGPGLLVVDGVLSREECGKLIATALPLLTSTNPRNIPPKRGYAFRNNDRCLLEDAAFAERFFALFEPILAQVPGEGGTRAVGVNPQFKVYGYGKGQRFGQHVDEPVWRPDRGAKSEYTLLLYLSGGSNDRQKPALTGGCTNFYVNGPRSEPLSVACELGRMCLHWTGHDFLHSGEEVLSGHKFVLRTDLFFAVER